MVGVFVEIPVVDGSSVGRTIGNFLQGVSLFAVDVGFGVFGVGVSEGFSEPNALVTVLAGFVDVSY